ncbi:histone deacetylase 6 isoform X3 [Drosophila miranda]|uniref:histone deacetylase 6 isoform X3 n=1 Tax=Drosophila miranda TaxID=7229 RepID=UPI00143F7125|nr:histone deacetylase 6 isoform X3 [Drosophila miranda]
MSSPIVTRRGAQQAKIQTRAMAMKSSSNSTATAASSSSSGAIKSSSVGAELPKRSETLLEAKRRARNMLKNQGNPPAMQETVTDIFQTAVKSRPLVRGETALVYHQSMEQHCCRWDPKHLECPDRFNRVLDRCNELKLLDRCLPVSARLATKQEILRLHTAQHFELLEQTSEVCDDQSMEELSSRFDSIYIHPSTFQCSLLASGSTIDLVDSIITGKAQNGMAIIRPPGHHAMKAEFNGYCFFNNLERILILDYDVHHGQGTQRFFYNDPRVLYFSIHRFEHGAFWPHLQESDYHAIGEGPGLGFNFNVPLNETGMGDGDYMAIFQQLLLPVAMEYQPELIIVSAGYDAALGCPEGEMQVTPAFYAHLLNPLLRLADSRVAVVLEGGYCLESLAEGAALTMRTLLGDPCPVLVEPLLPPKRSMSKSILNCIFAHRPYWRCLQLQGTYDPSELKTKDRNRDLHIVERAWVGGPPPVTVYPTRDTSVQHLIPVAVVADNTARLHRLRLETILTVPAVRVCYAYNPEMMEHRNLDDLGHPEQPKRIQFIHKMHEDYQLLGRMKQLSARAATTDEICLAHSRSHVNTMRRVLGRDKEDLQAQAATYNSVYLHPATFGCATLAAGSVLQAVDSVLRGESRSAICNVRPPGHHAEPDQPHGFCIFNNVAIAAQYAIREFGLKRVLILDWDVHHGNGTQHIFESNPKVLYISVHRYENGTFFPKGPDGNYDVVGKHAGAGFNVNIPWNKKGMGDLEYALAFQQIVMPIAYEFQPELVLVSAGFDAAIGDPLGGCKVSPEGYGLFTHWLSALAGGRIVVCLEGGYNVNSISYAMTMCTKTLLGDPVPTPQLGVVALTRPPTTAFQSCLETLQCCVEVQRQYWKSLEFVGYRLPHGYQIGENNNEDFLAASLLKLNISSDDAQGAAGGPTDGDQADPGQERPSDSKPKVKVKPPNHSTAAPEEMFAIPPSKTCPHMRMLRPELVPQSINTRAPCGECISRSENWMCLSCHYIGCGRYVGRHMQRHCEALEHTLVMRLQDHAVWCYVCGVYLDNPRLFEYKNRAHQDKYGRPLAWRYPCAKRADGCYPLDPESDSEEEADHIANGSYLQEAQ